MQEGNLSWPFSQYATENIKHALSEPKGWFSTIFKVQKKVSEFFRNKIIVHIPQCHNVTMSLPDHHLAQNLALRLNVIFVFQMMWSMPLAS